MLELAEEFARRNLEVCLLCNELSDALRPDFAACTQQVFEEPEVVDPFDFDLLWAQHHVLQPSLHASKVRNRKMPVTIFSHLSPYDPFETPGPFVERKLADMIFANSPETAEAIRRYGKDFDRIEVLANPAPRNFETTAKREGSISSLLVVSNHVPKELDVALNLLEKTGLIVERIGRRATHMRVTPEMLAQADAVITIGKTVQYALRARRPVFCYDRHAGPGWLCEANFGTAAWYNFSGRGFGPARSPEDLAREITAGACEAQAFAGSIPPKRLAPFVLEDEISTILERAERHAGDPERSARLSYVLNDPNFRAELAHEAALSSLINREYLRRRKLETRVARLKDRRSFGSWFRRKKVPVT
ncbi:hypothetical protein SAMN05421688_3438 [Poseidonocella pacifica]|uniref:Uncharacterized protein n=1 Tax=Poseidonocella pacifica TaxID=871651 RepID=A0A1I0YXB6_9RHOB|nr:hypothetical protein SAMN05421688_3438 [Poseidonocella pacifica]